MNAPPERGTLVKVIGLAVEVSAALLRPIELATYTVAEILLDLAGCSQAADFGRIKQAIIQRQEADAQLRLAEAQQAANEADLPKRRDAEARLRREMLKAEANEHQANADATRMDAETRRIAAIEKAKVDLLDALSRLRMEGGDLIIDRENLSRILQGRIAADTTEAE